jgi:hypothetical protein
MMRNYLKSLAPAIAAKAVEDAEEEDNNVAEKASQNWLIRAFFRR